jgi:large subunit ribosomal protein L32
LAYQDGPGCLESEPGKEIINDSHCGNPVELPPENVFVAVPKRRKSISAKGMRRSHDFLVAPALNICPQCKLAIPPHKVCELVEECGNVQRSKPHNPLAKEKAKK